MIKENIVNLQQAQSTIAIAKMRTVGAAVVALGKVSVFVVTQNSTPLTPVTEAATKWLGKYRYTEEVPAGSYTNQMNDGSVVSMNTAVGIAVRADIDEKTVYQITKAFWDNLEQVTSDAPWAKALDVKYASQKLGLMELHPGSERYYKEAGAL